MTPDVTGARGAGIWMAGAGLMSDGPDRIFLATGNAFDAPKYDVQHTPTTPAPGNRPPPGLGSSVLRLRIGADGSLSPVDFFTPCDAHLLDSGNMVNFDLGSGGVLPLPGSFGNARHRSLLLAGGKSGKIYLLDRNSLGGVQQGPKTAACSHGGDASAANLGAHGAVWGASTYWPGSGGWVYVPTVGKNFTADQSTGRLDFYHGHLGTFRLVGMTKELWGVGSGSPIVTSVGGRDSTAMVWDVGKNVGPTVLRVYGAVIGRRSHTPTLLATFPVGKFTKFAPPGVGTDQLFVGGAGHVVGFGVR
jgi:hypothetical protein